MKKTFMSIIISIAVIFVYLIVLKAIEIGNTLDLNSEVCINCGGSSSSGTLEKIGVGESISVTVVRPRWYGTIYVDSGATTYKETLSLFGLISLPLKYNENSYGGAHLTIIIILTLMIIGAIIWDIASNKNKYDNAYEGYYEED